MENKLKQFVEGMVRSIAESLGSLYRNDAPTQQGCHLIFPERREGTTRVSEQESKVLLCRYLDNSEFLYSVETPTGETYKQGGTTALSARTDMTVWTSTGGHRKRILSVELKAHNCQEEDVRKDLEKLVRERTDGVWFHTIRKANWRTFQRLCSKFARSFQTLKTHYEISDRAYLFVFCTLEPSFLLSHWVLFNGNNAHNTNEIESAFGDGEDSSLASWNILNLVTGKEEPGFFSRNRPAKRAYGFHIGTGGSRESSLILAPEINPRSFLHLSIRGPSYFLRDFTKTGPGRPPKPFRYKGCSNLEDFRKTVRVTKEVDTTPEDRNMSIDKRTEYWFKRISTLNCEYFAELTSEGISE